MRHRNRPRHQTIFGGGGSFYADQSDTKALDKTGRAFNLTQAHLPNEHNTGSPQRAHRGCRSAPLSDALFIWRAPFVPSGPRGLPSYSNRKPRKTRRPLPPLATQNPLAAHSLLSLFDYGKAPLSPPLPAHTNAKKNALAPPVPRPFVTKVHPAPARALKKDLRVGPVTSLAKRCWPRLHAPCLTRPGHKPKHREASSSSSSSSPSSPKHHSRDPPLS